MQPKPPSSLITEPAENGGERRGFARRLRNYLIAGLLIWIPIMVTVWVVRFLSGILDNSIVLLPPSWRPEAVFGQYVPGFGIEKSADLIGLGFAAGVAGAFAIHGAISAFRKDHEPEEHQGGEEG